MHPPDVSAKPVSAKPTAKPKRSLVGRLTRGLVIGGIGVVLLVLALPMLFTHTPLRHRALDYALEESEMHGSIGDVQFGWLTPLRIERLFVERNDQTLRLTIDNVAGERSVAGVLTNWPDLGTVAVDHPVVDLALSRLEQVEQEEAVAGPASPATPAVWTGSAQVRNVTVTVRREPESEPLVHIRDVDVLANVRRDGAERILEVEPVAILDNTPLTPQLFNEGLQLVAPLLANSASVQGRGTVRLSKVRVPLGANETNLLRRAEVHGTVSLRELEAAMNNPAVEQIAAQLAIWMGLELPETVKLIDSEVDFEIRDGRVYHDGLTFLMPDLPSEFAWVTSGSVGLDETLDLVVKTHLPLTLLGDSSLLKQLSARPVRFQITGTVENPVVRFPEGQSLLGNWTNPETEATGDPSTAGAIMDLVGGLLGDQPEDVDVAPLIDRVHKWRNDQREREEAATPQRDESRSEPAPPLGGLFRRLLRPPQNEAPANEPEPPPRDERPPTQEDGTSETFDT